MDEKTFSGKPRIPRFACGSTAPASPRPRDKRKWLTIDESYDEESYDASVLATVPATLEWILDTFAAFDDVDFASPTHRFYDNRTEGKPGGGAPVVDRLT